MTKTTYKCIWCDILLHEDIKDDNFRAFVDSPNPNGEGRIAICWLCAEEIAEMIKYPGDC